jgi:hypothetical protein
MKICAKCKMEKGRTEFSKATKSKDGLYGQCKACIKEKDAAHYLLNKESILARNNLWAKAHPEIIKGLSRKHYLNNTEAVREKNRLWTLAHPGAMKFYSDRGYIRNRETILVKTRLRVKNNRGQYNAYGAKYRAKKLQQTPSWVGPEEFKQIETLYNECVRLTKETGIQHHVDHYYPLNSSKGSGLHCLANLRIITATENLTKGSKWPE